MDIRNIDIEKVAKAVELDAGQTLPYLRESVAQAKRGEFAAVRAPEKITGGHTTGGRPTGSHKEVAKQAVTVRYSPDVL